MRYTSAPPAHVVTQRLTQLVNLAKKLNTEYEEAYKDGYLGVRTNFEEESGVKGKGSHSDPTADIVCSKLHTGIRRNTTTSANKIEDAFFALTRAMAELDSYKRGFDK